MSPLRKSDHHSRGSSLVNPGDSIYLGVGTTAESMAQHLKNFKERTVFTNALRTAIALSECPGCSVFLSGG